MSLTGNRHMADLRGTPEETRWRVVHALALQTINATYWDTKINGTTRSVEIMWAQFESRFRTYMSAEVEINIIAQSKVPIRPPGPNAPPALP